MTDEVGKWRHINRTLLVLIADFGVNLNIKLLRGTGIRLEIQTSH